MKIRTNYLRHPIAAVLALLLLASAALSQTGEQARWDQHVRNVTITRDDWGIAHVVGKTDADAVFGMIYAQAEDDFNRIEVNYLNSLGRMAEAEGESAIWSDLRMRLFIDQDELKKNYADSPPWMQKLMTAWADGLNYYLDRNPGVKPRVITRFEPWMALSFTEGSIGGDIERINLGQLAAFYGGETVAGLTGEEDPMAEPSGSNGIAIAPKNTAGKNALLLINPHTSFYFRSELQMTSGKGLNAYGAVTWGQFFIYQGFNERVGWMHTSSSADVIDEYSLKVNKNGLKFTYRSGTTERQIAAKKVTVNYKMTDGKMGSRTFEVFRTHHGPVVRKLPTGEWIAVALMHKPVEALQQSYMRTKAKNLAEYTKAMEFKANSSNNTLYADADGNIAYFHVNYMPRRDTKYDWRRPVDGNDPGTDYKGLHELSELPNLVNPASGWAYNTNNFPWSAAGPSSLKAADFPAYVDAGSENARGLHAMRVIGGRTDFTIEKLREAAYSTHLPWFEKTIPALIKAWDDASAVDPLKAKTAEQIKVLRGWDKRWSTDSVATSLAVFWADDIVRRVPGTPGVMQQDNIAAKASPGQMLASLAAASDRLTADFGKWQTPWGEINRFQRLTGDIVQPFDDSKPSIPVGFTSGNFGSLASFGARPTRSTKKWYGTSGNSFVAVVEFGKKVRAIAVTAGGESGDPRSKHFKDQAQRYADGSLREVYFYPAQLAGRTARKYSPGK
ncbi:MAG: penicillin acylase family protein [Chloracidobacterium sp.]|nr:penicillin acylase family protein [Chloracidobacterium sp.]